MSWRKLLVHPDAVSKPKPHLLRTLRDARGYMIGLPDDLTQRAHWQHAANVVLEAAQGDRAVEDATLQLMVALLMDGVLAGGGTEPFLLSDILFI